MNLGKDRSSTDSEQTLRPRLPESTPISVLMVVAVIGVVTLVHIAVWGRPRPNSSELKQQ